MSVSVVMVAVRVVESAWGLYALNGHLYPRRSGTCGPSIRVQRQYSITFADIHPHRLGFVVIKVVRGGARGRVPTPHTTAVAEDIPLTAIDRDPHGDDHGMLRDFFRFRFLFWFLTNQHPIALCRFVHSGRGW